ncbi:kinase-like domain-containing protein [Parasitella parasitica]|nr:kinase-like domain-containing protein [Parasitella parasitica]
MILSRCMVCETDLNQVDDPLAYHEQYLTNLVETNENARKIFACLLRILLIYKHDVRYKNSPRYLRLWIMYIFYLHTSLIYPTLFGLIDNKIGDKLAILYEAIAYQQLQERRHHDVEATLLLGINRNAHPLARLNKALQEFKSTGVLQFDINQCRLESYKAAVQIDQHNTMHLTKKPQTEEPLKNHLNWINLKLQHTKRGDILRQCHKRQCSYEELRAKTRYHRLIRNPNNMGQDIKREEDSVRGSLFYFTRDHVVNNAPARYKDRQRQLNVVQLPYTPGFIAHRLMLSGVMDRETYHLLDQTSAQKDILDKLKEWFHHKRNITPKKLISLGNDTFHVVSKLGQGGLANVYLVQHTATFAYYGLKVQQPPHPWEYYIFCQIHDRKSSHISVLDVYDFYQYSDASFLLMYLVRNGTLLDALNLSRPLKSFMPEPIVLIIITHLLEDLIKLHGLQIAHNDLKLDNIMLGNIEQAAEFPKIMIIDFGNAIDVSASPPQSLFRANWPPACPKSDFPQLNQSYPPFHADYWQLATIAHLLLYGTPMTASKSMNAHYSIQQPIRRYWHKEIWTEFFQILLNPASFSEEDNLNRLWSRFQQASQNVSQTTIISFTSMLQANAHIKQSA